MVAMIIITIIIIITNTQTACFIYFYSIFTAFLRHRSSEEVGTEMVAIV